MVARDRMIDLGLNALASESDRVFLSATDPATYADVNTTHIGVKVGSRGSMFYTLSTPVQGGRLASLVGFFDGDITSNGTATYVVVADSVNQNILLSEVLGVPQAVVSGAKFSIGSLDIVFGSSSQPVAASLIVSSPVIGTPDFAKTPTQSQNFTTNSPQLGSPVLFATGVGFYSTALSPQTGQFSCEFDVVASALGLDCAVALSNGAATSYPQLACIVLFTINSVIQVRNGSAYDAGPAVPYTAGQQFHIRMLVNVVTHIYSVFVTPLAQGEIALATNYSFRTEQNTITQINTFDSVTSDVGNLTVSNLVITQNSLIANPLVVASPFITSVPLNNKIGLIASGLTVASPIFVSPSFAPQSATGVVHGQDVTLLNTGRAGAASAGVANYSSTLTTLSGTQTYSTTQTIRNTLFTGQVNVTASGTVTFEFCRFTFQPGSASSGASHALQVYNNGAVCNMICNWCEFDTGLRGNSGNFETVGMQAGERGTGNPFTTGGTLNAYRCKIQGYGNGVCFHQWRSSGSLIQECYLADCTLGSASHADCTEIYSSDNITIQRCRLMHPTVNSSDGYQSCINITDDFGDVPAGNPVTIDSNYINGGISPVLTRWFNQGGNYIKNVRYMNNRFGDLSVYGRECDFNSMDVTFNLTYAIANPTVIYWSQDNVWAPNGEGVTNPATSPSGDVPAGKPHTAGAFVSSSNFYGGEVWTWNGSLVGPVGPPAFTAPNLTVGSPSIAVAILNNKVKLATNGLNISSPVLNIPVFSPIGSGGGAYNNLTNHPQLSNRPSYNSSTGILSWTGPIGGGPSTATDSAQTRSLSASGSVTSTSAGQVISGLAIANGTITIAHNNVIVRQCYVHGGDSTKQIMVAGGITGWLIEDCECSADTAASSQADVGNIDGTTNHSVDGGTNNGTIRRNSLHNNEQGIRYNIFHLVIKDNIFYNPMGFDCDQIECYGGSNNLTIDHNTFMKGTQVGGYNSAINFTNWLGTIGPTISVTNNWFISAGTFFAICDDTSQGGGSASLSAVTGNGFFNCASYRRNGITINSNSGNYDMATATSESGSLVGGNGAI